LVFIVSASLVASLAEMEKRIISDEEEYYLGKTANIKVQLVSPFDHEVGLESITRITYRITQGCKPQVSAEVNIDIVRGSMYQIPPHSNLTILDEVVTPPEPGEFRFNALGEPLTVMVHSYKEASLGSPNVQLNISVPRANLFSLQVFSSLLKIIYGRW